MIEIISRCCKLLIRDGLAVLAESAEESDPTSEEPTKYTSTNIKKLILHYIHQIFDTNNVETGSAATTIWDFLTEHSRRKFFLTINRDVLTKVHLNSLLSNILGKLNVKLTRPIDEIDFSVKGGKFLKIEDISYIGPTAKDYHDLSIPILAPLDYNPFSLSYVLDIAR